MVNRGSLLYEFERDVWSDNYYVEINISLPQYYQWHRNIKLNNNIWNYTELFFEMLGLICWGLQYHILKKWDNDSETSI